MKTLAVQRWPGPAPVPQDGLFAILIHTQAAPTPALAPPGAAPRDAARRQLRAAAREALAAVLAIPAGDISIVSSPGTPPRILRAGAESHIGISISHEDGYALAAINLHGAIGADIMLVQDIPDWHAVARDYLGPATAAALQAAVHRSAAFASAWTQREAALKLHAQPLGEWQGELPGVAIALNLPDERLAGTICIGA